MSLTSNHERKAKRAPRQAAGICNQCPMPVKPERTRCPEHLRLAVVRMREFRERYPEKARKYQVQAYGISFAEYILMLKAQCDGCAICGDKVASCTGAGTGMSVDHDHATGAVRGLLCADCNRGLGCFKDNTMRMEKAIAYLNRSRVSLKKVVS